MLVGLYGFVKMLDVDPDGAPNPSKSSSITGAGSCFFSAYFFGSSLSESEASFLVASPPTPAKRLAAFLSLLFNFSSCAVWKAVLTFSYFFSATG